MRAKRGGWLLGLFVLALALALAAGPSAPAWAGCRPERLAIAVDAGHGPRLPGATSATGAPEYDFNFRLARQVVAAVQAAGFPRTVLLDPVGRDLAPTARAKAANAAGAGLLVSIHHDAAQPQFLETWTVAGQTRRFCDRFAGYSVFYSGKNRHAAASLALARLLGREMRRAGFAFTRHHAADIPGERRPLVDDTAGVYRYDGLAVLREAAMPAVLLEAGVIVNRAEEAELAGPDRQRRTAEAVATAVATWCAEQR
ncbi:cell wall hydrolase/autolysin [Solidesulfovibrio carbinoliphilus subsp. oakridgensis]|uniref:N-acetylmuramoyl-L-alanine amidase n=1 Tax=Solidesulfovibrio carbinoliphilus subsp. oakridgensis TaxID=694327 RepID=G7Q4M7_9BACT|nr:N-acetylmuramoyl-L-alanine amidase [Solidesulfovibrio carbinoliphilus]EHJ47250.1 cell wall hydrolase/autolysin [Solidesulfovibrio carbinoliphilus subsp. oakridgensis]